jgi:gliding motility-associated-like protein
VKKIITLFILLVAVIQSYGQLTVSRVYPNNSINYLVQNILLGNGVLVSNITFSGDDTAIGFFNGINSNIGIDSGVLVTNASILAAPGPNNTASWTYQWPSCGTYHDSDLASLIGVPLSETHSSALLEFDFVPYSDTVRFQYVFGSEEYPEYVGSQFNDDFGFFVSGPGISGPYTNHAENIALIPNTTTPVAINNVNCLLNYNYYVCNWPSSTTYPCDVGCPTTSSMPSTTVQFDGFTTPLTATAIVECGKQYHIKIAICNIGDCLYASGVFLKSGSFTSSGTTVSSGINYSNSFFNGDTLLYRGNCDVASLYFERGSGNGNDTLFIDTSGTASPGIDYTAIPDTIIMPNGVTGDTLNISAFPSSKTGIQTIIITVLQKSCGTVDTQQITIYIASPDTLKANHPPVIVCYGANASVSAQISGGVGAYTYTWNTGATTSSITVNNVTKDTSFTVRITDACSDTLFDTVQVRPASLIPLSALTKDTTLTCPDTSVSIGVIAKGGSPGYTYSWNTGGTTSTVSVSNSSTKTYTVTITDSCGTVFKDSVTVKITDIPLKVATRDTTINCLGPATLNAFASGGGGGYTYLWNTGATTSTITEKPLRDTIYVVTVTSPCGNQLVKDTVKVTVDTKPLTVTTSTTQMKCPGDVVTISAHGTGTGSITYTWSNGLGSGDAKQVKPTSTTTYTVTVFDSCGDQKVTDTVTVQVPVILPMSATVSPDTITVCKEDPVNLIASASGGYGGYSYKWYPVGLFTDTLYNGDSSHAYLHGNSTAIYRVIITDGCGDTASGYVVVEVIPDCNLVIPNVITPNDSRNNYFYITNLDRYPNSKLQIFDRWGNKIYQSDNYLNNWSGVASNGDKLSDGVYYYILYLSNGKNYPGFIELIR